MEKGEKGGFGGGDFAGAEEPCDQGPVDVIRWEGGGAAFQGARHEIHPNILIPLPNEMGKHSCHI
jgi:hypothetical protein